MGFPLRLQPSCSYLTTLQPHFPYQSYLCHFDERGRGDGPRRGLQILVASGFYSGSIFRAGARLRLDVMSRGWLTWRLRECQAETDIDIDPPVETVAERQPQHGMRHAESMNLHQDVNNQDVGEGD